MSNEPTILGLGELPGCTDRTVQLDRAIFDCVRTSHGPVSLDDLLQALNTDEFHGATGTEIAKSIIRVLAGFPVAGPDVEDLRGILWELRASGVKVEGG